MQLRHYHLFETAIGTCGVAWTERGLVRVQLPDRDTGATVRRLAGEAGEAWQGALPDPIASCAERISGHLGGRAVDYRDVSLDGQGVPDFNLRIYRALREIGWGETTTYGRLAERAGLAAGAARGVGVAMARNPWPIVVPCHRVLASRSRLGGFSAPGGTLTKERLLELEGVALGDGTPLLPGLLPAGR